MLSNIDGRKASMIAIGGLAFIAAAVAARKLIKAKQDPKPHKNEAQMSQLQELEVQKETPQAENRMEELVEREGFKPVRLTDNKYCLHPEYLIELLNFIGVMTQTLDKALWRDLKEKRR